jgi:hypothetical protein
MIDGCSVERPEQPSVMAVVTSVQGNVSTPVFVDVKG